MSLRTTLNALILLFAASQFAAAGPPIQLDLVTEQGLQITAPQEWLQLLAGIGIEHVQIRGGGGSAQPKVTSHGSGRSASFEVLGVITSQNQLRLPGRTFTKADRGALKDYFNQLGADGADAVTDPRGRFGLTEKELTAVLTELAQPVDFETKGLTPRAFIDRLQPRLAMKPAIDAEANQALGTETPIAEELKGVAAGTALAIMLRNNGLVMRPEKGRGQPVVYRIVVASPDTLRERTLGRLSNAEIKYWPIGWESDKVPGDLAPSLFIPRSAEIDGYSLDEAIAAIQPLAKLPILYDRAALKTHKIDPAKIQVKLPKTRTTYKRVLDRILAQARLGSDIRVDEAGVSFVWITR